jgi:hypothetical protein
MACDVSLGSVTLPAPEAGDFVELLLLYFFLMCSISSHQLCLLPLKSWLYFIHPISTYKQTYFALYLIRLSRHFVFFFDINFGCILSIMSTLPNECKSICCISTRQQIAHLVWYEVPSQYRCLHSSGMLRSVDYSLVTDVAGQPIYLVFEDQCSWICSTLEAGTDRLSPNVCN